MKKVELTLNGKHTVLGGPGPKAMKVIDFIKSIKDGEYFNAEGVAERVRTIASKEALSQLVNKYKDEIVGHVIAIPTAEGSGKQLVFGSKKGINKLKAQLEIE